MSAVDEYRKEKVYLAEVCAAGTLEDLADAAIAELDDALHSAFDDYRVDFPNSSITDYDKWLALHVTCGKEMREGTWRS